MTSLSRTSCKGSHNSYDHDEQPITEQIFNFPEPYQAGCRGLELDIQRDRHQWLWSVGHRHDYKGWVDQDLREYLRLLRRWSDGHHEPHEPIYLHLDNKDEWDKNRMHRSAGRTKDEWVNMWGTQLDALLRNELGRDKLWSPSNLTSWSSPTRLIDVVRWPEISSVDLRGKFIPILTGQDDDIKQRYAELRGSAASMFADRDIANP